MPSKNLAPLLAAGMFCHCIKSHHPVGQPTPNERWQDENQRREIFRRHRLSLLGIGLVAGYLGAAPSLIWASGVMMVAAFVVLVPMAIWLYTVVFSFSSLWFAHYCLAALKVLRDEQAPPDTVPVPPEVLPPETLILPNSHASDTHDHLNP